MNTTDTDHTRALEAAHRDAVTRLGAARDAAAMWRRRAEDAEARLQQIEEGTR